ncbi:hypothetical protein D9C73_007577 [Collichthys lucidus]|uniref:Uncharacterized protein n=1 Tax=Collichthys lucidus TaxID=240159 RepID=A0A4U5UH57_COLLU|nr:hypothetical protein D9C73_007577 [Collichthys lucidus]
MSSQSMQTLVDPVFQPKMPLFDGTIASTGLSKPQNMSDFLGKTLQYNGAYFTYDPRGKEGARFTPPWSNSKTSLLDGRSPVTHLSGMEGQNHIIYRQDSNSSEEGHSHSSSLHHVPVKKGFTLYRKSPGISSPAAATSVAVGKTKNGSENSSPPSESSVYLAIPKPVYGHNPCCNELGCVIGQRYGLEHGTQRIPNTVYEHDWMQNDAHYTERPPIHRKAQDSLLQQRRLQFEPSTEPLKGIPMETYSPGRARTLPAMLDPNNRSYPCTLTRTLFGSVSEQSQRLQTSPQGYASLYPSHPTYENMTSEVYQEHSPMSKYGQLTQHSMFYYPQANVEVENRTQCKDSGSKQREDVPVILKHTISTPREHYMVPQSLHGEIPLPLPSAETLPNRSFMRGFDYPCYAVPGFHLNASQIRPPLTTSSPLRHVDQTSPTRRISQPGISPSSMQMNRFFPPLNSLHIDRPVLPSTGLDMDRPLDYSSCESRVRCSKQPKGLPVSPAPWLPQSPHHNQNHTALPYGANVRKIIYSPAVAPGNKHNGTGSDSAKVVLRRCMKRSISHSSPIKIKEEEQEDRGLFEMELIRKRQRVEMENAHVENKRRSPPMPVIDNVFSLAPYQAYLQASGVLFPGRVPQRPVQSSEQVKPKTVIKENRQDQDEQPVVSKVISAHTPTEKPVVETFELKNIKVEKVDPTDTDNSVERDLQQSRQSKKNLKKLVHPTCLKLSTYNIVLSDTKQLSQVLPSDKPPVQLTTELVPKIELQMPVRKHFFELHHSLHKVVSKSVLASSEQDLRTWLSQLELTEPNSPPTKVQKVSCLLGVKAREMWFTEEIKVALHKLLERLREYTALERCPFPHVMRTGAVFLPMLVVKELLFPTVQGALIDQVLQEHKVELRPTTLSEEKILIQLHKRACSSRLRRLMSLKHLPNIYADVVNLLYYTCVCKHLGLDMDDSATKEKDEDCEETISRTPVFYHIAASPASPAEPTQRPSMDQETKSNLNKNRTKSRVKSSSRRMFLDSSLSDKEEADDKMNAFSNSGHHSEGTENKSGAMDSEQDSSPIPLSAENSWTCPLSFDELSSFPSDPETEESSSSRPIQSSGVAESPVRSNNCSGVILKLRRMFSDGMNRQKAHYQAISDSGTFADPSLIQTDDGEKEASSEVGLCRRTPKVTHRWQRKGGFSHALRPLRSSSKRKLKSLLKIKYCPYLSACHSAEHRRRWVLRSAVQRAQRAMRFYYPDLVGKRIRHLYEEDDKSEVWYRGEVLRIHEAHTNPLKTIFEVRYDSEPEWKYYLELLIDYKKGWLKIED